MRLEMSAICPQCGKREYRSIATAGDMSVPVSAFLPELIEWDRYHKREHILRELAQERLAAINEAHRTEVVNAGS